MTTEPDPVDVRLMYLDNETSVVYVGQSSIGLQVEFRENATDWEVETNSTLFQNNLDGKHLETANAGSGHGFLLDLVTTAVPGTYEVPVVVRYTDDEGTPQEYTFDLELDYLKAWRLLGFKISESDQLVLEIETFLRFDTIQCEFDTDGSLLVDPVWQNMTWVTPGNYTFTGQISKDPDPLEGNADEVGYHLRGWVNGTFLELVEKNIDPADLDGSKDDPPFAPAGGIVATVVAIAVALVVSGHRPARRGTAPPNRPR